MQKSSPRPTSPHLGIYRPQISTVLSILHRITGIALFFGTAVIVAWLWTAAYAPASYTSLYDLLTSLPGRVLLLGWTLAFYYHLGNGIRHLFWDAGVGFSLPVMSRSGWAVLFFTCALTAFTWGIACSAGGQ